MRTIIESCMAAARVRGYIYMSTMSVHRLERSQPLVRTYQLLKRYAEKQATQAATARATNLWIFRLGQVHGELQAVSRLLRSTMREGDVTVTAGPSNTIFVYSIAEAIVNALGRTDPPGVYAAVSAPPWSWRDIHEHYARATNATCTVTERALPAGRFDHTFVRSFRRFMTNEVTAAALHNRDIIDNVLGYVSEYWQLKLRVAHAQRRAARALVEAPELRPWAPYPEEFVVPGRRLTLSDSRTSMHAAVARVRDELSRLTSSPDGATAGVRTPRPA